MNNRIAEIDYIKFVMITLMVAFHLVFIGNTYPVAKNVVYAFHMPCFLLLSGYVCNTSKTLPKFLKATWWLLVPYILVEAGYIYGASVFNIREHIDNLTLNVFLNHLLLRPLGPYWYLHTLILCTAAAWGSNLILRFIGSRFCSSYFEKEENGNVVVDVLRVVFFAAAIALVWKTSLISLQSAIYFTLGYLLKMCRINFGTFFSHHYIAIFAAVAFYFVIGGLKPFLYYNIVIVFLAMTISTSMCHFWDESRFRFVLGPCLFIGRNTLIILLFSPIFTIAAKSFLPYTLEFDNSGMLFLALALIFAIGGSLLIAWCLKKVKVDKLLPCFAIK